MEAAINERNAFKSPTATAAVLVGLGLAAVVCILRNNWLAAPSLAEFRFEEVSADQVLALDLY